MVVSLGCNNKVFRYFPSLRSAVLGEELGWEDLLMSGLRRQRDQCCKCYEYHTVTRVMVITIFIKLRQARRSHGIMILATRQAGPLSSLRASHGMSQ